MTVPFWKVQSTGNHFVLIEPQADWSEEELVRFVIQVSRPNFGVGSDGVLVVSPVPSGLNLRMFNPDGTEDFCGNGLRCAAIFGRKHDMVSEDHFQISHLGRGVSVVTVGEVAQTMLGPATYEPALVPHLFGREMVDEPIELEGKTYRIHAISTGSTHTVIRVDSLPTDEEFVSVSQTLENHPMFPERTSVMWMQEFGENEINLRIWERGAGETLGCGTGSTAAAVAYCRMRGQNGAVPNVSSGGEPPPAPRRPLPKTEPPNPRTPEQFRAVPNNSEQPPTTITVNNPGGSVRVMLAEWDASPVITGRAEILFEGEFHFR